MDVNTVLKSMTRTLSSLIYKGERIILSNIAFTHAVALNREKEKISRIVLTNHIAVTTFHLKAVHHSVRFCSRLYKTKLNDTNDQITSAV